MRDLFEDPWHQSFSGKVIDLLRPTVDDILLVDISHSLSNICRFGGATIKFYSVAQHSIFVSRLLPPHLALWGLLHDASEAYLGDVTRPLKMYLNGRYVVLEKLYMRVICEKFGLSLEEPPEIKEADTIALVTERRDLLLEQSEDWGFHQKPMPEKIYPVGPKTAEGWFVEEFRFLSERGMA
jgi:5'-deoxynucleotidase YfbR-like HD superfamily hydrolase